MDMQSTPGKARRLSRGYIYRIIGVVLLLLVASLFVPRFLSSGNVMNLIRQVFLLTLVSYGVALSLLVKGLDLSIGAVAALASCIAATLIRDGRVLWGVFAGLAVGGTCGLANGLLITKVRVPDFITTFSMMYVARGLAYTYTQGGAIYSFPQSFLWLGKGFVGPIAAPVVLSVAIMVVLYFTLRNTVFGKQIYATGTSKVAAVYSGIRTDRVIAAVYALGGVLSGFAGLVYVARMNAAAADLGTMWSLQAVASCIIGGITFDGGEGNILGLILGAVVISTINNCINLLGVPSRLQDFCLGFMIILTVAMDYYIKRRSRG